MTMGTPIRANTLSCEAPDSIAKSYLKGVALPPLPTPSIEMVVASSACIIMFFAPPSSSL